MIFSSDTIGPQISHLCQAYPGLAEIYSNQTEIRLHGPIQVHLTANDYTVRNTYVIDVVIPLNSTKLPYIIDTGHQIKVTYPHCYQNGELCLATDTQMRIQFVDNFDLVQWMRDYVETYFFSYEYYQRYKVFPFGDRAHGHRGILQTYQEIFGVANENAAYKMMKHIDKYSYRGHHPCPCGSENKIRNCHGMAMMRFYKDLRLKEILKNDLQFCDAEMRSD